MEFKPFPKMPRLRRDCIITEKIDGTNASILIVPEVDLHGQWDDQLVVKNDGLFMFAGSRTRFVTPKADNYGFANWVLANALELFKLGPGHHFGEWWGQKIQRGYDLKEKRFSLFNTDRWKPDTTPACCSVVPVLFEGIFNERSTEDAINTLKDEGSKAAPGFMDPEGIVIWHVAANMGFKRTIKDDEAPKGLQKSPSN